MEEARQRYREAYDTLQGQLTVLHGVLPEGNHLDPPKSKGLLNREARAKERYDGARRELLGLSD